jgi:predicted RNA-binding Zn-ribbon protein involved in translation (DUF1610 family)
MIHQNLKVCPNCGNNLIYWKENILNLEYKVNPKTGRVGKTVIAKTDDLSDNEGYECKNCGWCYNTIKDYEL